MRKITRRQFVSGTALGAGGFVLGYAAKTLILSDVLPPSESPVTSPTSTVAGVAAPH
jgi:hypothetical protein